jgi:hypothetical protein
MDKRVAWECCCIVSSISSPSLPSKAKIDGWPLDLHSDLAPHKVVVGVSIHSLCVPSIATTTHHAQLGNNETSTPPTP